MQVLSLTEARNNIKELFETVYYDNENIIIHRKGKESVVVISLEEYNSLKETEYLLKSKANREAILDSLAQLRSDRGFEKELIE